MMNAGRLHNAMGLCMKAGKCRSGEFACTEVLKSGKARLILIDQTASENTKAYYAEKCRPRGIPVLTVSGLAKAIGKPGRMAAAVTDDGFAKMIQDAAASEITENTGVE